jgi:hypothetical protein
MNIKKLNANGFAHHFLLIIIFTVFTLTIAVVGARVISSSKAATSIDDVELYEMGNIPNTGRTKPYADSTKEPWKTTYDPKVYANAEFWKGASTNVRDKCSLGTFSAVTDKNLIVGQKHITFKNTSPKYVNYFILNPDYQINGGSPRYKNLQRHKPGFYTKSNHKPYVFIYSKESNSRGYTSYNAKLSGYYLYKKLITPANGSSPAQYGLYRINCGAKKVINIKAPKAINGKALRDKAVTQIGIKEEGTNCGLATKKYRDYTGLPCGADGPWCAAFISWVYANTNLGIPNRPTLKVVGASQMQARLESSAFKKYVKVKKVNSSGNNFSAGDLLIRDPGQSTGHVGIVRTYSQGVLKTVEGNSGDMVKQNVYRGSEIKSKWDFYADWYTW